MIIFCRILCFGDRTEPFSTVMALLIWPAMRCTALRLVWRKRQRPVGETTLALGRDRLLYDEVYQAA